MEPRIQYAKTSDGVNIAYFTMGSGVPFVQMPIAPWDHIGLHHETHGRRWCESIAARMRLVRYDARGCGLSTRNVSEFSLETFLEDLRCVVDELALERFVLAAEASVAPVAIAYAVREPERVSHLLLRSGCARVADLWTRRVRSAHAMMTNAPDVYARAITSMIFGAGTTAADDYADFMAQCVDFRVARRMFEAQYLFDVTPLLGQVCARTLVTCAPGSEIYEEEAVTRLAAGVPGARLALTSRAAHLAMEQWLSHDLDEMVAFLEEDGVISSASAPGAASDVPQASPSGLVTILFTDIEGSTAMTQRLGDAKAREVLREHERITRECLREHGGAEVKTMGDGFMASFGSAVKALECAIAIQKAFDERNAGVGAGLKPAPTEALRVRIGLNAGEPIAEDDPGGRGDLFGTAVIRAARIAALAQGGEILAANVVRELAEGKGFLFGDRGEVALRGFDDPVRLFEVRWREEDA
jgi:class 3 adenylate cyclase